MMQIGRFFNRCFFISIEKGKYPARFRRLGRAWLIRIWRIRIVFTTRPATNIEVMNTYITMLNFLKEEKVIIKCDRCGKEVDGIMDSGGTSGFYHVKDSCWKEYAREGEEFVCDECIWKDPKYIKTYGDYSGC